MLTNTYPWQNKSLRDLPGEIWKPIDGYRDCYEISNFGRVKSLERKVPSKNGSERTVRERIKVSRAISPKNIPLATLNVGGIQSTFEVSRLVAAAFISNPHNHKAVSIKDSDPLNVQVSNLEWDNFNAKKRKKVQIIHNNNKVLKEFDSVTEAALYMMNRGKTNKGLKSVRSNITHGISGERKAYGYLWRFV